MFVCIDESDYRKNQKNGSRARLQYRRVQLYNKQLGLCCYCEKYSSFEKSTIEHLKPKSEGGTAHKPNIVMSCFDCNSQRPE